MIKKIYRLATNFFNILPIRNKLLLTYFFLIVVPLSFFTFLTYNRVSNVVQAQTFASASLILNEATAILDKDLNNISNVINIITHDKFIYEVSSKNSLHYDIGLQLEDSNRITDMFTHLKETTDVNNIKLYVDKNFIFSDENVNTFSLENSKDSKWYKILSSQSNNTLWCPPSYFDDQPRGEQDFFSAARILYNLNKLDKKLAILRVDIKKDKVLKTLNNATLTKNGYVMLMDKKNILLSSEGATVDPITLPILTKLPTSDWGSYIINGQEFYMNYKKLKACDWYIVSIIPIKDLLSTSFRLRNEMLLSMLLIAILSYSLAYLISKSSVKRLSLLTQTMRKVQKGNLKVTLQKSGNDEIGELMNTFNEMVSQISILLDEKYRMGQEIKNSELRALQAQINPHFLYNSLDLINCIAIKYNIPDIVSMVNALAKFYKLSLSHGKDIIPIKDELAHAQIYVQIQNMRFDNRIKLIVTVDEAIYDYSIQKILLQPIIENSIIHGIFEKESKSGVIQISGRLEDETILFLIKDDGVGMSHEKIAEVLSLEKAITNKGYGITNINARIKLAYGKKYGLTYSSIIGEGTKVEIRIPAIISE